MANRNVVDILIRARDEASRVIDEAKREIEELERTSTTAGTNASRALKQIEDRATSLGTGLTRFGTIWSAAVTAPMTALGAIGVRSMMQLETFQASLNVLVGDAEKAKDVFDELYEFDTQTTFSWPSLSNATRLLAAFNVEADDIIPTLGRLGDISAGVNMNIDELAEIFGKAKVQGRLFMEDVNQLTGRGIPVIQEFAKQFGVTEDKVRSLVSNGQIHFQHLEAALTSLTSEGGRFHNLMQAQGDTTAGRLLKLRKEFEQLTDQIGSALMPTIDTLIEAARSAVAWFVELDEGTKSIVITVGMAAAALGPLTLGLGAASNAVAAIAANWTLLRTAMLPFLGPVGLIALAVAGGELLRRTWIESDPALEAHRDLIDELAAAYTAYRGEILITSEEERQAAIERLNTTRTELQERLRLLQQLAEAERTSVQSFIDSAIGKFLLPGFLNVEGSASQAKLSEIDRVTEIIAQLGSDIQALTSGANRLVTPPPVTPPPRSNVGSPTIPVLVGAPAGTESNPVVVTVRRDTSYGPPAAAMRGVYAGAAHEIMRDTQAAQAIQAGADAQAAVAEAAELAAARAAELAQTLAQNAENQRQANAIMSDTRQAMADANAAERQATLDGWRAQLEVNAELQRQANAIAADTAEATANAAAAEAAEQAAASAAELAQTLAQNAENQRQANAIMADTRQAMADAAAAEEQAQAEAAAAERRATLDGWRAQLEVNAELQRQANAIMADTRQAMADRAAEVEAWKNSVADKLIDLFSSLQIDSGDVSSGQRGRFGERTRAAEAERRTKEEQKRISDRQAKVDQYTEMSDTNSALVNFRNSLISLAVDTVPFLGAAIEGFVQAGPMGGLIAVFTEMLASSTQFQQFISDLIDAVAPLVDVIGTILSPLFKVLATAVRTVVDGFVAVYNFLLGWLFGRVQREEDTPKDPPKHSSRPPGMREVDFSSTGHGVQLAVATPLLEAARAQVTAAATLQSAASSIEATYGRVELFYTRLIEQGITVNLQGQQAGLAGMGASRAAIVRA